MIARQVSESEANDCIIARIRYGGTDETPSMLFILEIIFIFLSLAAVFFASELKTYMNRWIIIAASFLFLFLGILFVFQEQKAHNPDAQQSDITDPSDFDDAGDVPEEQGVPVGEEAKA